MSDWRKWHSMALDSQRAARDLQHISLRSCASRSYYAAYQAITAVLLYAGCQPPDERESWDHVLTPKMIVEHLAFTIISRSRRNDMKTRLSQLYKSRVAADYIAEEFFDAPLVLIALKDANFLIKMATDILPGE